MSSNNGRKDNIAGGLGLLAVVSYLCLKGMKKVDAKLKAKKEQLKK